MPLLIFLKILWKFHAFCVFFHVFVRICGGDVFYVFCVFFHVFFRICGGDVFRVFFHDVFCILQEQFFFLF